jgi:hypothetical protein
MTFEAAPFKDFNCDECGHFSTRNELEAIKHIRGHYLDQKEVIEKSLIKLNQDIEKLESRANQ